jgi:Asp-tRNA(Asn)/Glu-tRNA(Gln) amidotransferase A subunit family amidase
MAERVAAQAVETALAAIARDNPRIHAITHLNPAIARARAALIDACADQMPLCGLTFVAKDLIDVAGLPTTCGSHLFEPEPATQDAACVSALQRAGAVVLGKSNMHELAVGSARNPWFGQVINPRSDEHGTGGTSSGTAAAVAAGFCDFGLGTDSGGSNRSTASATGLFGLKPTNGVLALDGIRPVAPSLDTVGILARQASVLAMAFAALSGQPCSPAETSFAGRVIGLPIGLYGTIDDAVQDALSRAIAAIRAGGGRIIEFAVDDADALLRAGRHILYHEFLTHHGAAIALKPDRVGSDVHAFITTAREVSPGQHNDALALVSLHREAWHDRLTAVDAILMPTAPGLAPRLSDEHTRVGRDWVPYGPAGAAFRMWANTIGIPAVSIPIPVRGGLSASVQMAARPHADAFLIDLSAALGREIEKQNAASIKKEK